jgi:hypothetical protein
MIIQIGDKCIVIDIQKAITWKYSNWEKTYIVRVIIVLSL